jgi:exodeoxyribonuclease VII large subunit
MINYSVIELNNIISNVMNDNFKKTDKIKLTGEISEINPSRNLYTFIKLKEKHITISVKFWRIVNFNVGDIVEIIGNVNFYNKNTSISFIGNKIIKKNSEGELNLLYEKNKKEFEEKGYFNNRKELPNNIRNVGLITAENSAAEEDFISIMRKRKFDGNIHVYNCYVQGNKCPSSVIKALKYFNNQDNIDVILITRGGGSFEDLIGFSDCKLVEAIYKSKKYTISAIGHEVDNMLSDYVANHRSPTPTAAAEDISSRNLNTEKKLEIIEKEIEKFKYMLKEELLNYRNELQNIIHTIKDPINLLKEKVELIDYEAKRYIQNKINKYKTDIEKIVKTLESNNPDYILEQGFVIMTDKKGNIISNIDKILKKKSINLITSEGSYIVSLKKK